MGSCPGRIVDHARDWRRDFRLSLGADLAVPITRDQELWALALSIERKHGNRAADSIAERVATFERSGPPEAATLCRGVQKRFEQLSGGDEN